MFTSDLMNSDIFIDFSISPCLTSCRLELLEPHLEHLEQFDQALLTLTQKSENFLSGLRNSSQVDITELEAAITKLKVRNQYRAVSTVVLYRLCLLQQLQESSFVLISFGAYTNFSNRTVFSKEHEEQLQAHASLRETLQQRESSLLSSSTAEAQQQLQGWREDCLQPLSESQRLLHLREECLAELRTFLEKHGTASKAVRRLHEAVEGRGSWDRSKAEELHCGIGEVAKDVARLEAEAVGLDGQLSKAHLHLCGAEWKGSGDPGVPQGKTSCRGQTVALIVALEAVQRGVGWRQSEADALGALWSSFRERREEVTKNLKKLEDDVKQEPARESSIQAFQNR